MINSQRYTNIWEQQEYSRSSHHVGVYSDNQCEILITSLNSTSCRNGEDLGTPKDVDAASVVFWVGGGLLRSQAIQHNFTPEIHC